MWNDGDQLNLNGLGEDSWTVILIRMEADSALADDVLQFLQCFFAPVTEYFGLLVYPGCYS